MISFCCPRPSLCCRSIVLSMARGRLLAHRRERPVLTRATGWSRAKHHMPTCHRNRARTHGRRSVDWPRANAARRPPLFLVQMLISACSLAPHPSMGAAGASHPRPHSAAPGCVDVRSCAGRRGRTVVRRYRSRRHRCCELHTATSPGFNRRPRTSGAQERSITLWRGSKGGCSCAGEWRRKSVPSAFAAYCSVVGAERAGVVRNTTRNEPAWGSCDIWRVLHAVLVPRLDAIPHGRVTGKDDKRASRWCTSDQ